MYEEESIYERGMVTDRQVSVFTCQFLVQSVNLTEFISNELCVVNQVAWFYCIPCLKSQNFTSQNPI